MTATAAKIQNPGELEASQVAHAASVDEARPHMNTPFGCLLGGKGFICATDGHRVALWAVRVLDRWVAADRGRFWLTYQNAGKWECGGENAVTGAHLFSVNAKSADAARLAAAKHITETRPEFGWGLP